MKMLFIGSAIGLVVVGAGVLIGSIMIRMSEKELLKEINKITKRRDGQLLDFTQNKKA